MFNALLILLTLYTTIVAAQFQFFDSFFQGGGGGGGGGHHHQQQQQGGPQNVASDSNWYKQNWEAATCSNFLCPDTLACVAFPHHCPCPHEAVEDKVELGEGIAICASRGGFKDGEMMRKVELARKGLL